MFYKFCKLIIKIIFKIKYKLVIHGDTNLSKKPLIICANHISNWDPFVLAIVFDRQINYMGKKELFENKILGFLLSKAGVFPVDRKNVNIKTIKYAINLLKEKKVLGIFPEGTRVTDINESNMKTGISMIASRANADIIPVYIKTDYKFGSKVEVFIRDEIKIDDFKNIDKNDRNKQIIKSVYANIYKEKN